MDNLRSREEGGGGLQGERKSSKVTVRHREHGNGDSRGTAGPSEYQVKLVPGPECGRRRGELLNKKWQKSWLIQVSATSLAG